VTGAGKETVVYSFTGGADGGNPVGSLIFDPTGNAYGTTKQGGAFNKGTVFKLSKTGQESVLHSFGVRIDGYWPQAGLVRDKAGNLYGTTLQGGTSDLGTVFKVAPNGDETVLHSFAGAPDGQNPDGTLIILGGMLYGTTYFGGASGNGSVFKVDSTGTTTVLYSFSGFGADEGWPWAGLVADKSGNVYGTTSSQISGNGTVFELAPGGTETVLYSFTGGVDGANPTGGLFLDAAGNLYGTAYQGGQFGDGTVFKLAP